MATIRRRKSKHGYRYQVVGNVPTKTFLTRADAKLYRDEEERKRRLGEHWTAPAETFGAHLDGFMAREEQGWEWETIKTNRGSAKKLEPLRDIYISQMKRGDVQDVIQAVARKAPARAGKCLELVKRVLKDADGHGHKIDSSILYLKAPKYERRKAMFLTLEELRLLAAHAPEKDYRIILVAGMTGMRQGELFSLTRQDLFLDDGYLEVRKGKTENAKRRVYLTDEAVRLLREQLLVRRAGTNLVFPAPKGQRWSRGRFGEDVFVPAREAAGFPDVTFHHLRHTFVSLAAQLGMDRAVIGKMAGWSPAVVDKMLERYRHVYGDEVREAVQRMSEAMEA